MRFSRNIPAPFETIAIAAAALLLWWVLVSAAPRLLPAIEELSGDWAWRLAAGGEERRIVLVDIDEASLSELGPWPWPRERLADLSDRLAQGGAALQVWDIVFAAPAPGDERLAARLIANRAVLAQVFALDAGVAAASGTPADPLPWAGCPAHIPRATGYLANPSAYAGVRQGHIAPRIGEDGIVRHQPALICHEDKVYPALFIGAVAQALTPAEIRLQSDTGWLAPAARLTGPAFGASGIPLDDRGDVRIPWTIPPRVWISLSARDVLAGRIPSGWLDNAWVVVGGTALGLSDRVATPLDPNVGGLAVHAQLLSAALDDRLPAEPRHAGAYALGAAACGILALVALGRQRRKSIVLVPAAGLVVAMTFWGAKTLLLLRADLWFPWTGAALYVLLFSAVWSLFEHARNLSEKERLYRHLSSYLPGPVAAVLARKDPSDAIDAERLTVTALYADIRNFSAYCERRPPEEAAAVLHAFFAMATRVVERHGGTVEAFQGDAVLAVWSAGEERARHGKGGEARQEENALAAACEIFEESQAILPQDPPDGLAPLAVGIGLETGLATVGSFGLARRRTHLAMGRTITTAARLQEMTVELAHPILLGEGLAAILGLHRLESQGVFLLEGLTIPCHVYALPLRSPT